MWLSLALGLGSGLVWGAADFGGGLLARRISVLAVALWGQLVGAAVLTLVVLTVGATGGPAAFAWGVVGGACGGIGLLCFYRGLAIGPMSIVAPVSSCGRRCPCWSPSGWASRRAFWR